MKDNKQLRARIRRIAGDIVTSRPFSGIDNILVWRILQAVAEQGLPEIQLRKESAGASDRRWTTALLYVASLELVKPAHGGHSARKDSLAGELGVARKTLDRALTDCMRIARPHVTALNRGGQLQETAQRLGAKLGMDARVWLRTLAETSSTPARKRGR